MGTDLRIYRRIGFGTEIAKKLENNDELEKSNKTTVKNLQHRTPGLRRVNIECFRGWTRTSESLLNMFLLQTVLRFQTI